MIRCVSVVAALLFMAFSSLSAQNDSEIDAIIRAAGVTSPEDLDEYELERLESMIRRPLRLNSLSVSKLVSTGLFTAYQAASLADYRNRHGDVMSFVELASIDGFSEDFVRTVRPFLSLEQGSIQALSGDRNKNELTFRSALKMQQGSQMDWNYAARYSLETFSGWSAGLALSRSYTAERVRPDAVSGSLEYEFAKLPMRLIVGDYNTRYGQGLALWNGMSMSGLASPSAFMKRASGISRSSSFSGTYAHTGLAAAYVSRHIAVNLSVAVPEIRESCQFSLLPAANIQWNHEAGQVGLTHYADFREGLNDMKSSVDAAWNIRGADLFAEIAYDWLGKVPAAVIGVSVPAGECLRSGALVRAYPSGYNPLRSGAQRSTTKCSNEYALTSALEYTSGDRIHYAAFSVDLACFPEGKTSGHEGDGQLKFTGSWNRTTDRVTLKTKVSERIRSWGEPYRTEIRTDLSFHWQPWNLNLRLDFLHCKSFSGVGYAEAAYVAGAFKAYLRYGMFRVDNWDDRIYVYERDAPGGFNVPAMYGRGLWLSSVVSFRLSRVLKVYLRGAHTSYPFMESEKKKPGKAELKVQCIISF